MNHFQQLLLHIPNLREHRILDLGSGRGNFLIMATQEGADVVGVEPYNRYREITKNRAQELGLTISVIEGNAEHIPFKNETFDFVNANEVFEHVEDPRKMLQEIHRVLRYRGYAYISIPNRFGFRDPHYHVYAINWIPRGVAERIITLLGKKKYGTDAGRQQLSTMHYKTFAQAKAMFTNADFEVFDIRKKKIKERIPVILRPLALFAYIPFRFAYFSTFHFLLRKK